MFSYNCFELYYIILKYINHKITDLNLYKLKNFHSFMKFAAIIKSESYMTRMMKSGILSICEGLWKICSKNILSTRSWIFDLDVIYYHCFTLEILKTLDFFCTKNHLYQVNHLKYIGKKSMNISKWSKRHKLLWPHSSTFLKSKNCQFYKAFYFWECHWLLLSVKCVHSLPENM